MINLLPPIIVIICQPKCVRQEQLVSTHLMLKSRSFFLLLFLVQVSYLWCLFGRFAISAVINDLPVAVVSNVWAQVTLARKVCFAFLWITKNKMKKRIFKKPMITGQVIFFDNPDETGIPLLSCLKKEWNSYTSNEFFWLTCSNSLFYISFQQAEFMKS